jgi:hypothetical protein
MLSGCMIAPAPPHVPDLVELQYIPTNIQTDIEREQVRVELKRETRDKDAQLQSSSLVQGCPGPLSRLVVRAVGQTLTFALTYPMHIPVMLLQIWGASGDDGQRRLQDERTRYARKAQVLTPATTSQGAPVNPHRPTVPCRRVSRIQL